MSKLVQRFQNAKAMLKSGVAALGPDREFENLIRSIGESKSKQEEDRIILAEIETLKQRLSDPKLDKSRGREYMMRAIYCEMLGHDTSWMHIKALQFACDPNIHTKKVGGEGRADRMGSYLACACMHPTDGPSRACMHACVRRPPTWP